MTDVDLDAERLIALLARRPLVRETLIDADWERLLALALQHGVAPVVYSRLKERGLILPSRIADELRQIYLASAARNMHLFHELGEILRALQAAGVPVIPLKGACLAEAVYGNIALRPMDDVDLLVKPGHIAEALGILRLLGYLPDHPFDPIAEQAIGPHMPPISAPGGVTVELHWTIVYPGYHARFGNEDLEGLWSRVTPATIGGVSVLMFSPTDLLLHVCMHVSAQHRFDDMGLRAFLDMAQVCRRHGDAIDWKAFAARSNEWGIANGVRLALQLSREWTDLDLPSYVLPALDADPPDDALIGWARHKILHGSPLALRMNVVRVVGEARIAGKLRALWDAAFPSREEIARMYLASAGSWRILGYYPVRFRDLWTRYRRALWQVVRRDKTFIADAHKEARLREYLGWR